MAANLDRGTMPAMVAKLQSGQSIKDVIAWAQEELEGIGTATR